MGCVFLLASLAAPAPAQFVYSQVYSFGGAEVLGGVPEAGVIEDRDGVLYGTARQCGQGDAGVVFRLNPDGSGYRALWHFTGPGGRNPTAALIEGSDGALYGTTPEGLDTNQGTVFRLKKDGTQFQVLHHFARGGPDGAEPRASLLEGSDGALYGTTYAGGNLSRGTIFRMKKDGSAFVVLHRFAGVSADGANPSAALIEGKDGRLYGTTDTGGAFNAGTVFALKKDGTGYVLLRSLEGRPVDVVLPTEIARRTLAGTLHDGSEPAASLLQGRDGTLYGITSSGGKHYAGTVFKLKPSGLGYGILWHFGQVPNEARVPKSALIEGRDGRLYGTTEQGGPVGSGAVFTLNKDGSGYTLLRSLAGSDGCGPHGRLCEGRDGALYATTTAEGSLASGSATQEAGPSYGTVVKLNKDGTGFKVLWRFTCRGGGPSYPSDWLVLGHDGTLLGAAANTSLRGMVDKRGGLKERSVIFRLKPDGSGIAPLSEFLPAAEIMTSVTMMEGREGVFYGTSAGLLGKDDGMVFRVGKDGSQFKVLHRFNPTEGAGFKVPLAEGTDGFLYGVAPNGGVSNAGTIFRLQKDGAGFTVLRHFTGRDGDGKAPNSPLVAGPDGALFGTTDTGGTRDAGTAFRINPDGSGYTVLHRFTGRFPSGAPRGLILGSDGTLYGTTRNGGARGLGTVFKLNPDGTGFAELRSFQGGTNDGRYPEGPVAEGPEGVLYGTTNEGGNANVGTVFKLKKDGSGYAVLWRFQNDGQDGQRPRAVLLHGPDGALYGATPRGGSAGLGTVFRLGPKR